MKNAKNRRENSGMESDFFEGEMLWFMLRQLRNQQIRRRRAVSLRHNKGAKSLQITLIGKGNILVLLPDEWHPKITLKSIECRKKTLG